MQTPSSAACRAVPAQGNIGAVEPEIRVAWRDGFALAYQVVGGGDRDIVYLPGYESNVDLMWDIPAYRSFLDGLGSLGRLITHDRRGLGCSDRLPPGTAATLEETRDDLLAVMDAAGSRRATVFAVQEAVFAVLLLAATRPERIDRLVFFGASPSYAWSEDLPDGWTGEQWDEELRSWAAVTSTTAFTEAHARSVAPSLSDDDDALHALGRLLRSTEGMGAAISDARTLSSVDVRDLLPSVEAPTLVIRREDDGSAPASGGRFLAERVAEGRYVEIPGRDSLPWVGDSEPIMREVARFVGPSADVA
jgi:pimeloyl-ACP methyl ester carboxylesterase